MAPVMRAMPRMMAQNPLRSFHNADGDLKLTLVAEKVFAFRVSAGRPDLGPDGRR